MKEFKFSCPACSQHILSKVEWSGRRIACPSCETRITIPAPAKTPKKNALAAATAPATSLKLPGAGAAAGPSAKTGGSRTAAAGRLPPSRKAATSAKPVVAIPSSPPSAAVKPVGPEPAAEAVRVVKPEVSAPEPEPRATPDRPEPPGQPRVAVLSPAVKLEIVRAVRERIADKSAWLPGKVKGATAYAATMREGEEVLLDAKDPEATRFSLIGAFLIEMSARRVARTAGGRKRFLDEEIPEAIRDVLDRERSDEESGRHAEASSEPDVASLSHAECLAVLRVLEERYSQRAEQLDSAKSRLGSMRLSDLVKKLEKKADITPAEVATALYHELREVRRRLEDLENRVAPHE